MHLDNVRLCVDQAINLSPMRMNGYDLENVPCDHTFVSETFDHDELLYRYACQASESSTPPSVFKLLLRWFPSDFVLRHRITLDEDMTFMLAYDVYHRSKDCQYPEIKRYKVKPGKLMSKLGRGPAFCQAFAEEWAEVILPLKNKLGGYNVRVLESTEDIVDAYMHFSGELDSCLCYELDRYSTDGIHPAVVYGDESNVHMAVVSHADSGGNEHDISRTLIYDKSYVKIYPACDTNVCQTTKVLLKDRGIANGTTDLDGAKLNLVYTDSGNVVCPYLDGKPYVEISNEVGIHDIAKGIKPRKYLQVGDTGFDTTQSSYYEVAAFDPETYRMPEHPNHECRHCSSDVYTDGDSPRHNAHWDWYDERVFCSEECLLEYGHVYAYVGRHDLGWVASEDCDHHDNMWYYDGCYEYHDLVMTDEGELQPKSECMNLGNVWFLTDDLNTELLELMHKQYPNDDYVTEMYELYKSAERKENEL